MDIKFDFKVGYELDLIKQRNISIFRETRGISLTKYSDETENLISDTRVFKKGSDYLEDRDIDQKIEVIKSDSITAGFRGVHDGCHVGVLNFADGCLVGGLVVEGAKTQEETLCRCSNLYESLKADNCASDYYVFNQQFGARASERAIYSPNVTFFRDKDYNLLNDPVKMDVISCPAPICIAASEEEFIERIMCVLGVAEYTGVDYLVLGAWGCGAFGNNPFDVAAYFKKVLDEYKVVRRVVFPMIDDENYNIFRKALEV